MSARQPHRGGNRAHRTAALGVDAGALKERAGSVPAPDERGLASQTGRAARSESNRPPGCPERCWRCNERVLVSEGMFGTPFAGAPWSAHWDCGPAPSGWSDRRMREALRVALDKGRRLELAALELDGKLKRAAERERVLRETRETRVASARRKIEKLEKALEGERLARAREESKWKDDEAKLKRRLERANQRISELRRKDFEQVVGQWKGKAA